MAAPLAVIAQNDFSGGVNLATNPYLLSKKQVWRLRNMIFDTHGSLRTRPGSTTLYSDVAITDPVVWTTAFTKISGVTAQLAITSGASINKLWQVADPPASWSLKGNFTTNYDTPYSVTFLDTELIAPGYEVPKTWDGSTFASITALGGQTVPPGAKHCAVHLGSAWLWNTSATVTTLDGPSALRMAAGNKLDDWPNANQTFISKDDGQVGMGLAVYTIVETGISPLSTLIAYKNFSAYQISGVFGASNFSVQKIKSDMGCVAPRSSQFCSGFGVVRLTHKGFALFNGVDDKLISEEIRPAIFGNGDDFSAIDWTNAAVASAGQAQNPPMYVCGAPVSGKNLTRIFVYDLVRRSWTICDYPNSLRCLITVTKPTDVQLHAGGTAGNILRIMNLSDTTDNGALVGWSFRSAAAYIDSPTNLSYWRRMLLNIEPHVQQGVEYSITLLGNPIPLQGGRNFGFTSGDTRTAFEVARYASSLYVTVSGSGNVRVNALSWQGRRKPLTTVFLPGSSFEPGIVFDPGGFDAGGFD